MTFEKFPILQTERLVLRQMVAADAESVFAFRSDREVQRYNGGAIHRLEQASELIQEITDDYRKGVGLEWGVTRRGDDSVLGIFGYTHWSDEHQRAEIGYCLHRGHWRQGIAQEAMRAILTFGFGTMGLNRIHACPWADNIASVRLLEKLGFHHEGTLRDEYWQDGRFHDERAYALLRREFVAR